MARFEEEEGELTFDYSHGTPTLSSSSSRKRRRNGKPVSSSPPSTPPSPDRKTISPDRKTESKRRTVERKRRNSEEREEDDEEKVGVGSDEKEEEKKRRRDKEIDKACLAEIGTSIASEVREAPEWVPTPLEGIDWVSVDAKEEDTTDRSYCFLCQFSQSTAAGANVYFTELMEFIDDNYHRMELMAFLGDVQEMYNLNLRPHLKVPEHERLPWYKSMIFTHLQSHSPTRHRTTERNIKRVLLLNNNYVIMRCI
jgi:hypothetical protein